MNNLKKKLISNKFITLLLVVILFAAFIGINLVCAVIDLPNIDVTSNRVYTLSDASKNAIKNVTTKINIVTYGFDENSNFINFVKQYVKANEEHLSYEILSEDSNNGKVQKYALSPGYIRVILEAGNSYVSIDPQSEFTVFDYTTYSAIDRTEQVVTNAILDLDNKDEAKKVYFLTGHEEYDETMMSSILKEVEADNFDYEFVNLLTKDVKLTDNDVLAIMSPKKDLSELEYNKIMELITSGVNIFYTQDYLNNNLPNFSKLIGSYGASIVNGYIVETDSNYTVLDNSILFIPQVSNSNKITAEIFTDSYMMLAQAGKLSFVSEDGLKSLKVIREDLVKTTEYAVFTGSLENEKDATALSETGEFVIGSLLTKDVSQNAENKIESKLIVMSTGAFAANIYLSEDANTVMAEVGSNSDFLLNSFSELTNKTNYLTIRKDMNSATFTPTEKQSYIVAAIAFLFPVVIILIGIVISTIRKRRK